MITFIVAIVVLIIGIWIGRFYEIGKRFDQKYVSPIPELRQRQFDNAMNEGYSRAKMNIHDTMTLDETALALHRIEGLAKAFTENVTDMKAAIGKYGTESTRPDERTETN